MHISAIEAGIDVINVLFIQPLSGETEPFAEALEVHDLSCAEELDDVADIRIVGKAKDVVVGHTRLLLGGKVFGEIGDGVTGDLHGAGRPRVAGGELREHARCVIDKVGIKAGLLDLILGQIARELMNDRTDHLKMPQLLGAQRSIGNVPMYQI